MPPTRSVIGNLRRHLYGNGSISTRDTDHHKQLIIATNSGPQSPSEPPTLRNNIANAPSLPTPASCLTFSLFPSTISTKDSIPRIDESEIVQVMRSGLAKGTQGNYTSAVKAYLKFCDDANVPNDRRFPAEEIVLCGFLVSMNKYVAGSTASTTITGLKRWHEFHGMPWNGTERTILMVKGVSKNAPASSKRQKRIAVSTKMLHDLHSAINHEEPKDVAIFACASAAFFGQVRMGEFTGSSRLKHDPHRHSSRSSVIILLDSNSREIHLPRTKTNQSDGQSILITRQHDPIDPVKAIEKHFRVNHNIDAHDHLFAFHCSNSINGRHSLTLEDFLKRVNEIWTPLGHPRVTGHSFRIGGTTALLKSGVPPDVVKELGRWSSDAFFEYWRDLPDIAKHHVQFLDFGQSNQNSILSNTTSQARHLRTPTMYRNVRSRLQGRPAVLPY